MVKEMDDKKKEIQIIKGPLPPVKSTYEYETYYKYFEKTTTLAIIEG